MDKIYTLANSLIVKTFGRVSEATLDRIRERLNDLHATVLHLLGLDHKKLTYRYNGRDFRLTDVAGEVVSKILA